MLFNKFKYNIKWIWSY